MRKSFQNRIYLFLLLFFGLFSVLLADENCGEINTKTLRQSAQGIEQVEILSSNGQQLDVKWKIVDGLEEIRCKVSFSSTVRSDYHENFRIKKDANKAVISLNFEKIVESEASKNMLPTFTILSISILFFGGKFGLVRATLLASIISFGFVLANCSGMTVEIEIPPSVREICVQDECTCSSCPTETQISSDSASPSSPSSTTPSTTTDEPHHDGCIPNPSQIPNATISELSCREVKIVDVPYALDWKGNEGGISNWGFRMALPYDVNYALNHQEVKVDDGSIEISGEDTTPSHNMLGVGLDVPNQVLIVNSTLSLDTLKSGGIYFGMTQRNVVLYGVSKNADKLQLYYRLYIEGNLTKELTKQISTSQNSVVLGYTATPSKTQLKLFYVVAEGRENSWEITLQDHWFGVDAAGMDFFVGTRTYGGIFGNAKFTSFGLYNPPKNGSTSVTNATYEFTRWSFPSEFPTGLTVAPDGYLYVASAVGHIKGYKLNFETKTVVDTKTINILGERMVLGLTVDPESTADHTILWASHSWIAQYDGKANSGVISKIDVQANTKKDVITGLPRAINNHATNQIRFDDDGLLYINQGGTTGGGASNSATSEFGPRPEQPLTAAIMTADVRNPNFKGNCASLEDPDGVEMDRTGISPKDVPCDVKIFASGIRNSWQSVHHRNGFTYATDNGLGILGTTPRFPDPGSNDCSGMITENFEDSNPGVRPDLLHKISGPGYFGGHPNPTRNQCIYFGANPTSSPDFPTLFKSVDSEVIYLEDPRYPVGTQPDPTFKPAMFTFGIHKSANGMIEYKSDAFCGTLDGDLLVTYYSTEDQVRRVVLDENGDVKLDEPLKGSSEHTGGEPIRDPLGITQDAKGRIFVGEFNIGNIVVFDPVVQNC